MKAPIARANFLNVAVVITLHSYWLKAVSTVMKQFLKAAGAAAGIDNF
jgi:hypothetical protein